MSIMSLHGEKATKPLPSLFKKNAACAEVPRYAIPGERDDFLTFQISDKSGSKRHKRNGENTFSVQKNIFTLMGVEPTPLT